MANKLNINDFLLKMIETDASDLYIAPGVEPRTNVNGVLNNIYDEPLTPAETEILIRQMISEEQWTDFQKTRELNIAYSLENTGRFRVNIYFQRGTIASVIRQIKVKIPNFADLNLPKVLGDLITAHRGMLLVTGATGSGKSTSMAAMIDHRATIMDGHIVSVEDPIEYVFQHKKSIVTQREVGLDTLSFKEALKNTLRQAPNVIYIGELRDSETVEFALHSAETGHLVLATLHSTNVPQSVERILNFFPRENHHQVLMQVSYNLKGIVSQRLIPKANGGRLPILEILINTAHVQEIIQKGELGQLKRIMELGQQEGMQTFDMNLKKLVETKEVTEDMALKYADSPSDLRLKLRGFESSYA